MDPRPLERAATELALYDWLVFTSANAVEAFMPLTGGALPARIRVAVVGPATAEVLRGFEVERFSKRRGRTPRDDRGSRPVCGPPAAASSCRRRPTPAPPWPRASPRPAPRRSPSWPMTSACRRTPRGGRPSSSRWNPWAGVTFTSPRIVRHFAGLFGNDWERRRGELRAVSIGPVTSAELRRLESSRPLKLHGRWMRRWWRRW